MFNFKQRLLKTFDLLVVLLLEIKYHGYSGALVTLFKLACIRTHVKSDVAYFVGLVVAITRHNDCTFEFVNYGFLDFCVFGLLVGKALAFMVETLYLLINELETAVD